MVTIIDLSVEEWQAKLDEFLSVEGIIASMARHEADGGQLSPTQEQKENKARKTYRQLFDELNEAGVLEGDLLTPAASRLELRMH